MKTTTVPVATFNDFEPAQKLHQRIIGAGLPAAIRDESKLERLWFMTPALAAIHIEVPEVHFLEAKRLIVEWDKADGALKDAVRCPECQSSRVEFPQLTRKFFLPSLLRFFMALRIVPKAFYCVDCHHTWPMQSLVEPERDILGFPREKHPTHFKKAQARQRKAA